MIKTRPRLLLLPAIMLAGCSTTPLSDNAGGVALTWDANDIRNTCERRGTLIGSQGSWYNYWFISDRDLTRGALNQLQNQAYELGANKVSLYSPPDFSTSVTLIGNAYYCE
ncbi:DUF4156 domain-containing protein [Photobacterium sp. DA100]|uniref:DUF4156 domain-containing protein n=1 Tax=Photobacterium sp. DA100 TaxID=3027472 RepID=UPI00247AAF60|nr:DUF4156 domain-containing protein [Photobacterium sp. DA100]WEM41684.1 DUF4156 domain-containing protein [Photobacterium sp. DA100]